MAAYLAKTASSTSTTANGLTTSSYNAVSRSESSLTIVSASADSTTAKMVLRVDPANIGITASGTRNVLVAYGGYSGGTLSQHASSADRARISVTFTKPDPTTPSPDSSTPSPDSSTPSPNVSTPSPNVSTPSPNGATGYLVSYLVAAVCGTLLVFVV